MLDDRFGGKVYNRPRPLINPDDGTLYAPSTPEHKAHQIRQQQTGNYSYVYTPKVYSNTPIIKPTSYAQAQAQRDRAREQALAEQRRQQNIRNEYSRATGSKGKAKTREAQNLFKNWGAALSSMYTHVCKTAKRWVDSGVKFLKNVDWKKVGVTVGAIGVGIALTVATGGLGAPAAMALGGAATGAIISGYDGYTSGKRGWELVGAIGQGAGVGALTGFVGGHLMGAGAGIATSATQNIRNQAVRHVVKAGIEAGVETAVDTGISVATGSPVTLKNVVTDYGLNLVTNGSGSVSNTSATKPIKVGGVEVYDANYKYTRPIKDVTPVNNQKLLTGPDPNALRLEAPQNVTAGTYRSMSKSLRGTDYQAHHVNQAAMMKKTVPNYSYSDGVTVPLVGNIRTDVGSPHYNAHATLEEFYDQYRRGGDKYRTYPTVGEYNDANASALRVAGLNDAQVNEIMSAAKSEQRYYGLNDSSYISIPRRIYLPQK